MEERTEVFLVKKDDRAYCNCKLTVRVFEEGRRVNTLAEEIYSAARSFCERIFEIDRENERERRERFKIVPYGYCLIAETVKLTERISVLTVGYSFFSRFPGGDKIDGEELLLFDEKTDRVIPRTAFSLMRAYSGKGKEKKKIPDICFDGEALFWICGKEKERIDIRDFDNIYAKLVPTSKKGRKGIDNF